MSETGVVKFRCEHIAAELAPFAGFDALNACRRKLRQLGMIGVDENGIGYGNLSVRAGNTNAFHITASGTGGRAQLALREYAKVVAYDLRSNWLRCEGVAIASSESLTHAAVYESDFTIGAVIHCHHATLWAQLPGRVPATSADVEYGTPEMAFEVQRLFRDTAVRSEQIFVMGGHEGGVVTFGEDVEAAFAALTRHRFTR